MAESVGRTGAADEQGASDVVNAPVCPADPSVVTSCTGSKEHDFAIEHHTRSGWIVTIGEAGYLVEGDRRQGFEVSKFRSDGGEIYLVRLEPAPAHCTCSDFLYRAGPQRRACKH